MNAPDDAITRLQAIHERHIRLTRQLTLGLSAFVCSTGLALWAFGVPLLHEYKPLTGLLLMLLAVVFYKVPYVAYRLNRRYFSDREGHLVLMGETWDEYKARIIN